MHTLEIMCSFFFSLLSICWLANNISDTMARMQMKADSQWTNIYSDGDKYTIRDSRSNLLYVFIIHVFLLIEYFVVVVVVSTRRCCCCCVKQLRNVCFIAWFVLLVSVGFYSFFPINSFDLDSRWMCNACSLFNCCTAKSKPRLIRLYRVSVYSLCVAQPKESKRNTKTNYIRKQNVQHTHT